MVGPYALTAMERQRPMDPPPTTTRPTSSWKMSPDKPALVTPSASPPPSRPTATASTRPLHTWAGESNNARPLTSSSSSLLLNYSNRLLGSVSPPSPLASSNRAASRVASSTPKPGGFFSRNSLRASSSSSHSSLASSPLASGSKQQPQRQNSSAGGDDPIDIHKEREASVMRLMGAWSQLSRHVKRLDEDDIVDLVTGNIIKDNGVLRGSRIVKFGDDAEEEEEEEEAEEDDEEEDEEDEEDDQLDTLGDEDLGFQGVSTADMPPVSQNNAKDAEDLRAFLESGKEIGTEPEDDDFDDELDDFYDETSEVQEEDEVEELDIPSGLSDPTGPEESDSEDELNFNWAEDEASIVIPVLGNQPPAQVLEIDDDDIIEIIEPPLPPKSKGRPSKTPKAQSQLQLYTPPHSRSSIQTPPDDNYITPPPFELPPPDISPEIPITVSYSNKKVRAESPVANGKTREDTATPASKKTKAEVIISRRTPFLEAAPKEVKKTLDASPNLLSEPVLTSKSKGKREKSVVEIAPPEDIQTPSAEGKASLKTGTSSLKTRSSKTDGSKPKSSVAKQVFPSIDDLSSDVESVKAPENCPPASPRKRKRSSIGQTAEDPAVSRVAQVSAVASSSKTKIIPDSPDMPFAGSTSTSKDARRSVHQRSPRKQKRSKSHPRQPESRSESDEDDSDEERQHYGYRHGARSGSYHPPSHGMLYPYPQPHPLYSHPPPLQLSASASGSSIGGYPPAALNHQTQFIVSQVMHQLSALATGHWGPMPGIPPHHPHPLSSPPLQEHVSYHGQGRGPFTPTHQHHYRRSKSKGPQNPGHGYDGYGSHDSYGGNVYSTPQHNHRHIYPYMYNSDMSRGTAPPDTPEYTLPSSSPMMGERESSPGGRGVRGGRKKSLVERSRSRGRNVSFKTSEKTGDAGSSDDEMDAFSSSPLAKWRSDEKASRSKSRGRGKGDALSAKPRPPGKKDIKGKGRAYSPEVHDSEEEEAEEPGSGSRENEAAPLAARGRHFVRGRTSGPVVEQVKKTSGTSSKPGRTRASSQHG